MLNYRALLKFTGNQYLTKQFFLLFFKRDQKRFSLKRTLGKQSVHADERGVAIRI